MSEQSNKCPVCEKPSAAKFTPFCTQRCADLDLGRWLKGTYVIPAAPDEAEVPEKGSSVAGPRASESIEGDED